MTIGCRRLRPLLHRPRGELGDAARLALEEHLGDCDRCSGEVAAVDGLRRLTDELPLRPLGAARHQRAIERALAAVEVRAEEADGASGRGRWRAGLVLCASGAAAAAIVLFLYARPPASGGGAGAGTVEVEAPVESHARTPVEPSVGSPSGPELGTEPGDRVVSGELRAGDRLLGAGEPLAPEVFVRAEAASVLSLGPAAVTVSAGAELAWEPERAAVRLQDGRIGVALDRTGAAAGGSRSFRVATASFTVEVTGTEFEVTSRGVRVSRGSVRITAPDGAELIARLGAGESWELDPVRAPATGAEGTAAPGAEPVPPGESIVRARRALVAGQIAAARRAARQALEAAPTRREEAEARTLLAECAQAAGRPAEAITLYLAVADRFGDLDAGEVALYAAARLQANRGHDAEAARLLRRYLDRHPRGRFVREARDRLRVLDRDDP